jgi:AraC-like DNA-binding protein
MGYNPYRWWTRGTKQRNRPLPYHYPLAQRIGNGDYDLHPLMEEWISEKEKYKVDVQKCWDEYKGDTNAGRWEYMRDRTRMQNLRVLKLAEESHKKETELLFKLREELKKAFKIDLWDEAVENCDGDIKEFYEYYAVRRNNG